MTSIGSGKGLFQYLGNRVWFTLWLHETRLEQSASVLSTG
jgi:hypothetical protein